MTGKGAKEVTRGPSKISVVVGGQFGSEAKGHVTARLVKDGRFRTGDPRRTAVVRVAGPNAGHSAVGYDGNLWALRQIPVGMVADPDVTGVIAAGSEIDPEVLQDEIARLEAAGYDIRNRLVIDGEATILEPQHKQGEKDNDLINRVGSTGKGIGACRADRLLRDAVIVRERLDVQGTGTWMGCEVATDTGEQMRWMLSKGNYHVIIEGTQGFGLGLHAGFYPYCTSSDCRAIDFLAMTGLAPWDAVGPDGAFDLDVWVVLRPYPIRVAGHSGPLGGETTWEELGLPQERTTVTKKVRRVGQWDPNLARRAVQANGGSHAKIAFTMADQVVPGLAGTSHLDALDEQNSQGLAKWVERIEVDTRAKVAMVTTGPDTALDLTRTCVLHREGARV